MPRLVALLLLASLCFSWQKKGKSPKPPDVTVEEAICRRFEGDVLLDGRVRITAERPVAKLRLLFDFLGADRQLLQTKRTELEDGVLRPGEESEFHLRVADPVRAVLISIRAEDGSGRELNVARAGPYPIE